MGTKVTCGECVLKGHLVSNFVFIGIDVFNLTCGQPHDEEASIVCTWKTLPEGASVSVHITDNGSFNKDVPDVTDGTIKLPGNELTSGSTYEIKIGSQRMSYRYVYPSKFFILITYAADVNLMALFPLF